MNSQLGMGVQFLSPPGLSRYLGGGGGWGGGAAPCCCWTVVGVRLLTWLPLVGWGGGLGGEPHDCWVVLWVLTLHSSSSEPPVVCQQRGEKGEPCYHLVEVEVQDPAGGLHWPLRMVGVLVIGQREWRSQLLTWPSLAPRRLGVGGGRELKASYYGLAKVKI